MPVQITYQINPEVGFPGMLAEPNSPHRVERGVLNIVASQARLTPRPGDAVFYNTGDNAWQVPDNAANRLAAEGILSYRQDDVGDADSEIILTDGAEIEVITMGVVWVVAGAALERGNQVSMQVGTGNDAFQYIGVTRATDVASIYAHPITCYSISAADNGLFKAAIGYGRAI